MTSAPGTRERVARAQLLLQLRRPGEAEREARAVLAREPEHAGAHMIVALALSAQGDAAEALDEADRAIALSPGAWFGHWVRGVVLSNADRTRRALRAFEDALACDAEQPVVYERLARAHYAVREYRLAVQAAETGLRLAPDDGELAKIMSLALVETGDPAGAREHAARAVRLAPESASAHRTHGAVALATGDPRTAAGSFREALRLAPETSDGGALLLRALKRRNRLRGLDVVLARVRNRSRREILLNIAAVLFPPWFVFMILLTWAFWLNWVIRAGVTLRLARDPGTRRLLDDAEVTAARVAAGFAGTGAVLLALSTALWTPALVLPGIAFLSLVMPVQEAALLDGRRRTAFVLLAGTLGAFVAVLTPLAYAAPHLDWVPVAALLTFYAAMASTWLAMIIAKRPA
ncbi:tetratricopeptide repeat protein [Actinomadura sp. KC06]|uniref:tetratricopeptide repeat protein n=1 Tax=Actinomadura sp. KC06 TaxID=2530369 RepID=UPI001051E6D3|nr:tetratricopeptide repeat protein [Actinomadura sp. KC06]TDD26324.1 tetratricopeptide repeat protein [Actinomadura sp. KC06]